MKIQRLVVSAFLAGAISNAAAVSMVEKVKVCATCHGETGIATIKNYPNLAGQNRDYLVYALKAYQKGERTGGLAIMMQQQAVNLSETEIAEIADYYANLK